MKMSSGKERCLHISARADIPEIQSSLYPTNCQREISLYEGENLLLLVKKKKKKGVQKSIEEK